MVQFKRPDFEPPEGKALDGFYVDELPGLNAVPDLSSLVAQYHLNADQADAISALSTFLKDPDQPFFVLRGYAGTGKTYLTKVISQVFDHGGVSYTSPTNKATKVLRKTLQIERASCKTIYSMLGIKMVAENEYLQLKFPDRPVDLRPWKLIIIDEASMLTKEMVKYIRKMSSLYRVKFLLIGDEAQLPPVGERISPVWKLKCPQASLEKVMRFDNELLELATRIRRQIQRYPNNKRIALKSNHSDTQGVWKLNREAWFRNIKSAASSGLFSTVDHTKAVAWRNRTVDEINALIRYELFGDSSREDWVKDDRVLVGEPVLYGDVVVAHIDDEGTVRERYTAPHTYHPDLQTDHLTIEFDEGRTLNLNVIHRDSEADFQIKLSRLAAEARKDHKVWRTFWALKNDFHRVRYSYALTAHRAQGSTYKNVFLDSGDVMSNSDELEALKCLYVGCTRSTEKLILV